MYLEHKIVDVGLENIPAKICYGEILRTEPQMIAPTSYAWTEKLLKNYYHRPYIEKKDIVMRKFRPAF